MKNILFLLATCGLSLFSSCVSETSMKTISPDGGLICNLKNVNDSLFLSVHKGDKEIIASSPLLIHLDGANLDWELGDVSSDKWNDEVNLMYGENKTSIASANQSVYQLYGVNKAGERIPVQFCLRVFDKAVSYRFVLDLQDKSVIEENSQLLLGNKAVECFIPNGEFEPLGNCRIEELEEQKQYFTPFVWNEDGYWVGLHESSLHNYPQMRVTADRSNKALSITPGKAVVENKTELPWRIFTIGENFADLHNNKYLYYNLSRPATGNYEWVQPGKAVWDWRVRGCKFSGFTYDLNTASLKRFIDFASRNGIRYCLIDAAWYKNGKPLEAIPEVDIQEVISYGNKKGVGLWLYYDLGYMKYSKKETDFNLVAKTYSQWGAKGIKFGFLGNLGGKLTPQEKVKRTEELIRTAAQYKLMLDFHDNPVPFSGLERTYPNYLSREYCHAQMDRRTAFTPGQFVKMACVNLLAGPMDQSNGVYELNKIKERSKGPRNAFNSTLASENARFFITHTGHFSVLIDAPEAYENKPEMFEFIRNLPDTWDETLYLDMDFNSHVSVARRNGETWFVGTVYNEDGGNHKLCLDFLDKDSDYEMTVYQDAGDTHYVNTKETFDIKKLKVNYKSVPELHVAPGGGYTAIIRKI